MNRHRVCYKLTFYWGGGELQMSICLTPPSSLFYSFSSSPSDTNREQGPITRKGHPPNGAVTARIFDAINSWFWDCLWLHRHHRRHSSTTATSTITPFISISSSRPPHTAPCSAPCSCRYTAAVRQGHGDITVSPQPITVLDYFKQHLLFVHRRTFWLLSPKVFSGDKMIEPGIRSLHGEQVQEDWGTFSVSLNQMGCFGNAHCARWILPSFIS